MAGALAREAQVRWSCTAARKREGRFPREYGYKGSFGSPLRPGTPAGGTLICGCA